MHTWHIQVKRHIFCLEIDYAKHLVECRTKSEVPRAQNIYLSYVIPKYNEYANISILILLYLLGVPISTFLVIT